MAAVARNPWLAIPLADYEAHMALPEVGQAELLADAVRSHAPHSVAVLGCAGGNGFERVPPGTRLVGMDVNPDYVAAARVRHGARVGLELFIGDVTADELPFAPSMRLVPPAALTRAALAEGYTAVGTGVATAGGGKRFAVQTYRRS